MKPWTIEDAERAVPIDKHALDEENVRQPQLMFNATREYARAKATLARAEREKANLSAELDTEFRDANDGKKLTVDQIKANIRSDPRIKDLNEEIIVFQQEVDTWSGMVDAMKQRNYNLTELGDLHRANYYTREAQVENKDFIREAAGRARRTVREND